MDKFEARKNCLFCLADLNENNPGEHVPFKKTKLFYNCAQTLCKVLTLPKFPFSYFFNNAGYCHSCRRKVEDMEMAVQKIADLQETVNSIRVDIEVGVKQAFQKVSESSKKRFASIKLPQITNESDGEIENILRNKFKYRQVLKIVAEKIETNKKSRRKRFNGQGNANLLPIEDRLKAQSNSLQKKQDDKKKAATEKRIIQVGNGKLKRGRKKGEFLNPVVVLEKIVPNSKSKCDISKTKSAGNFTESVSTESSTIKSIVTENPTMEQTSKKSAIESNYENPNTESTSLISPSENCNFTSENQNPTEESNEIFSEEVNPKLEPVEGDGGYCRADKAPLEDVSASSSSHQKSETKSRKRKIISTRVKKERPPEPILKCSVDVCTEIFNKKADLNAHIKEIHPGLKHNCDKCDKQYLNKKHLLDHLKTKHSGVSETFDCEICGIKFSYGKGLKAHRIRKHKSEYPDIYETYVQNKSADPIPCVFENCPEVFALKMDLGAHIKEKHKGERRFKCEDCGKTYINKKHLASHKTLKHSGMYPVVCDKCGKAFNFHKSLIKHMEIQHGKDHLLHCHVCAKTFEEASELEKHALIHEDDIPFRCDICNELFTNSRDLKHHVRSHSTKAAKCEVCGKMYSSLKNLKDHQLIHNDVSTWPKCEVCKKPFKSARHLRKHMIVHSNENQYQCELCGEGFKYSSYLLKHNRRKHTMLRPFSCLICNKGFYETTQLKRHEEIHSGFKKYICDVCGKAFRTLQNHYQHYRTHNKEYRSQQMYKNIKRRALKASRKKPEANYTRFEISEILPGNFEVESPIIYQCSSPLMQDDDQPGHLIPIPAEDIHTYYEQGDTIVVVNDMEYHKFTY